MTNITRLILIGLASAAGAEAGLARAQTPDPAAAPLPAAAIQVNNTSGKSPIVAVYTSPPGRPDWGDDMIGKTKIQPGKSLTLKFKAKPAGCKVDMMVMLDNGDTHTQPNVDVCAPAPAVGF